MNWSKIKTIIIYFLVVMNIFLLICMAIFTYSENTVPEKVLISSAELLRKDGFNLDESVLPGRYITLPTLHTTFYSPSDLADIFFNKQLAFRIKEDSMVAAEDDAALTVTLNSFSYKTESSPVKVSASNIKRKLKKAGIDMSGAVYDEKNGFFYKMYKGHNLFNMYIKASIDKDGNLCEVSGQWPMSVSPKGKKRFSFTKHVPMLSESTTTRGEIKNIECGYMLKSIGGNKYVFSPSWRIFVDNDIVILESKD